VAQQGIAVTPATPTIPALPILTITTSPIFVLAVLVTVEVSGIVTVVPTTEEIIGTKAMIPTIGAEKKEILDIAFVVSEVDLRGLRRGTSCEDDDHPDLCVVSYTLVVL
jgi:hypothetical protein